jgi:hypothetical protein
LIWSQQFQTRKILFFFFLVCSTFKFNNVKFHFDKQLFW